MPDILDLKSLTDAIESSQENNPMIERWVDSSKQLQKEMVQRIVFLCLYYEQIPEGALKNYVDTLIDILEDKDLLEEIDFSDKIKNRLSDFANLLEDSEDSERAISVRNAIQDI